MKKLTTKNLALAAMFIAIGLVLPMFTGQIPQIGSALLPMHLPVLLCGIVCGWQLGLGVGFILPLLRFMIFGMPPIYPIGLAMAFELAAYGLVIGLVYAKLPKKPLNIYLSLVASMLVGRVVWGVAQAILLGVAGNIFTLQLFLAGAFVNAIPGIILQIILVPVIIFSLEKTGFLAKINIKQKPVSENA